MADIEYIFDEDSGTIYKIKKIIDSPHDDYIKIVFLKGVSSPIFILTLEECYYIEDLYSYKDKEKKYYRAYRKENMLEVCSKNDYVVLEDDELD